MVIDFGHDVTVGPMQLFMYKAFNIHYTVCAFACNIYFELHKKLNKQMKNKSLLIYNGVRLGEFKFKKNFS